MESADPREGQETKRTAKMESENIADHAGAECSGARYDQFLPEKRSAIMRTVRSKNTKPEVKLRSILHRLGYRFRLHCKGLPGTPDVVLAKHRTAIFVNGCFWHRHDCRKGQSFPKTRPEFWRKKFGRNVRRDEENQRALSDAGWNVLTIWECELKGDAGEALEKVACIGDSTT